jgi:hypothetical protein
MLSLWTSSRNVVHFSCANYYIRLEYSPSLRKLRRSFAGINCDVLCMEVVTTIVQETLKSQGESRPVNSERFTWSSGSREGGAQDQRSVRISARPRDTTNAIVLVIKHFMIARFKMDIVESTNRATLLAAIHQITLYASIKHPAWIVESGRMSRRNRQTYNILILIHESTTHPPSASSPTRRIPRAQ